SPPGNPTNDHGKGPSDDPGNGHRPDDPGNNGNGNGNGNGPGGDLGSPFCDEPGDAAALAALRATVESECDCAGASNHGRYVSCVARMANKAVRTGDLRAPCRQKFLECAGNSTCGRPGSVACCRTDARGNTRCSIKRSA